MPQESLKLLRTGTSESTPPLVLAHGAGAGMQSPFMAAFGDGLADRGISVIRFEFPYMQQMTETGRRRPPSSAKVLEQYWRDVIAEVGPCAIGGKSMGGRIASQVADDCEALALVCLGYPFHPPGKPEKTRTEHLKNITTQTLICQGTRDPFGTREDVSAYSLAPTIEVFWLEDGNHSLEPRRASGRTIDENWAAAMDRIADFLMGL